MQPNDARSRPNCAPPNGRESGATGRSMRSRRRAGTSEPADIAAVLGSGAGGRRLTLLIERYGRNGERKSAWAGKSVSVRLGLGWRRNMTTEKRQDKQTDKRT